LRICMEFLLVNDDHSEKIACALVSVANGAIAAQHFQRQNDHFRKSISLVL
jgi:hypothetical protein